MKPGRSVPMFITPLFSDLLHMRKSALTRWWKNTTLRTQPGVHSVAGPSPYIMRPLSLPTTLVLVRDGSIARLTLNRPDKRNALDETLIGAIRDAFSALGADESVRVITLTGAGGHFCSGLDLHYLQKISEFGPVENLADSKNFRDMLMAIYRCPKPVIAQVSGYALAGGCGIASACDLIIADTTAQFGYTEVRFGFVPAIVSPFLVRRVGESHAKDLLLTARIVSAEEAARMSLVSKVVAAENLSSTVAEYAHLFAKNSASSLALTKGMFESFGALPLTSALDHACDLNARTRQTPDFKAGLAKFLEKK